MPRLPYLFAKRYLFSKKSHSIINAISVVSALAVAIPVMAMVILLSVFNGLEGLIKSMYSNFDPDILIAPARGKVFDISDVPEQRLLSVEGIEAVSYYLEEGVLFGYRDGEPVFGTLRGVDSMYSTVLPIDTLITSGEYRLRFGDFPEAVVGQGMAYSLGLRTHFSYPLSVYIPRKGTISVLLPSTLYKQRDLFPSGIFALDAETDSKYVLAPIDFAQELLNYEGKASAVSVKLIPGASESQVKAALAVMLGDSFKIQSRYEQKEEFYRIMVLERWGIFFIALLVLIVASFSLIGSLVMLIIDKQKDISTLISMGSDIRFLRNIFTTEGMLIYGAGAMLGLILGLGVAFVQQTFGIVGIGAETFLVDAYPVKVKLTDILLIIITFTALSYIISHFTVRYMIPKDKIRIS